MFLGAYVEKTLGRPMHVWDGECHVHAGIKPADITAVRAAHPGADFLIHPECGCSTSVMEYVAAGDVDAEGVHMLSTGGMLGYARGTTAHRRHRDRRHRDRDAPPAAPGRARRRVHRRQRGRHCRFMKMITLPKLRDALRDGVHEVKVPAEIADRARRPDRADGRDQPEGRARPGLGRGLGDQVEALASTAARTAGIVSRLRSNSAGV